MRCLSRTPFIFSTLSVSFAVISKINCVGVAAMWHVPKGKVASPVVGVYSVSILCRKWRHSLPMYWLAANVAIIVVDFFMCFKSYEEKRSCFSVHKGFLNHLFTLFNF